LVNNNKMLSHITEPVMDDIVKIYNKVTGSDNFGPDNPIIPLGEILGTKPKFPDIPRYNQAAGEGLLSFEYYKSNIPGEFITVTHSIEKGNPLVFVNGEWVESVAGSNEPLSFVGGEWVENAAFDAKSSFTQGLTKGITSIDDSIQNFVNSKEGVSFDAIVGSSSNIQSIEGVVDQLGNVVEDVIEDAEEVITRTVGALLTLLKPDKGSGADEISNTLGDIKKRTTSKKKEQILPVSFSDNSGPKQSIGIDASPVTIPKQFMFDRSGVVPGKTVCTCHNPTFSGASLEKEVTTVKAVIRTIEQNLASGLSLEENKEDWNSLLVERNAYLTSIEGKDPMTNSSVCSALNGVWKCAVDVREVSKPSSDVLTQNKNIELKNALPTNKAFDTSKIGL
jgi:hypothetical protein